MASCKKSPKLPTVKASDVSNEARQVSQSAQASAELTGWTSSGEVSLLSFLLSVSQSLELS